MSCDRLAGFMLETAGRDVRFDIGLPLWWMFWEVDSAGCVLLVDGCGSISSSSHGHLAILKF